MMKTCREATRLMSESQERDLHISEQAGLKLHLAMCTPCRNFSKQLKTLRRITQSYAQGGPEKVDK
ncbi:zf-HC2 domain-containing protein [Microbulbifer sp. OS29]|uniref:Zf-HC2 domain-containing protein n=1 Tax=Microbulbifer okhotskensis TaxID=2926617 RepID=A0A9X2ELC7_9GAMM|nr:zf-HC2 domain-containing protein [Microbulbifer okhotskensis]MCO1334352.1 zf-HC2 domain-containing protein [Microbulbifer okhotskensis]